jgi:hypothetical protein
MDKGGPQDGNGDGNGGGGNGNGQGDGGGQPPLAYQNAAQLLAAWNAAPSDEAKDNLEQEAVSQSPAQDVQFAAMLKINLRMQALVVQLNTKVNQAQGQVATANTLARQAQAAAHSAANVDPFRPAAPQSMGTKRRASMWVRRRIPFRILVTRLGPSGAQRYEADALGSISLPRATRSGGHLVQSDFIIILWYVRAADRVGSRLRIINTVHSVSRSSRRFPSPGRPSS